MEQRKPVVKWHSVGLKVGQGSYVQLTVEVYKGTSDKKEELVYRVSYIKILWEFCTNQ